MEKEKSGSRDGRDKKTEKTNANIEALEAEEDTALENEAEIRKLKLLKKNYQTDFENGEKECRARKSN